MLAYQASSPLRTTPLRRRASGLALALAINLVLLLILLTLGRGLERRPKLGEDALVVDLIAGARSESRAEEPNEAVRQPPKTEPKPPLPKPRIVLPVKPSLAPPSEKPWIEMSKAEMAAADVRNLPKVAAGSGAGDSEEVGRGRLASGILRGQPFVLLDGGGGISPRRSATRVALSPRASSSTRRGR